MKSKGLLETISELKDNFQYYLETKISYYGLTAFEKTARVLNYIVSNVVVLMIFFIAFGFASFAAALYIGKLLGYYEFGFLIIGGVYFLLGIVLFIFREKIFGRCIIKALTKILFHKEEDEH